jgi:hypothetical protein
VWGHTLLISGKTGYYISVRTYSTHFRFRQDITSVWGHILLISGKTGHYISVRTYSTHFRSDRILHQCEDIFYSFQVRQDITSVWGHILLISGLQDITSVWGHILLISGQTGHYISVRTYSTHFTSDRTLHQWEDIFYSFQVRQDITSVNHGDSCSVLE